MSEELPPGWTQSAIGALGAWVGGGTPSKAEPSFWTGGAIPWVSPKDMKADRIADAADKITEAAVQRSATRIVPAGSVLVVTRSGILEHSLPVAVTDVPVAINQDLKALVPASGVDAEFVALGLKAYAGEILQACSKAGTTVANINLGLFQAFPFPLPPLAEQRRIVARIGALFERTRQARADLLRIAPLAARYRQRTIAAAVSPSDRDDWLPCTIADVAEVVTGTTPPTANREYFGGDTPFVKPTDLDAGYHVAAAREGLTDIGLAISRPIPADTTLLTCIGATIGKTGFARVPCATNQQINALVPKRDRIEPRWLYWLVVGPEFQESVRANASATTLPILNKGRLERLGVLVPSLEQQRALVDRIEALLPVAAAVEHEASRALALLDHLERSILTRAFRGELVPQDPSDEPASTLRAHLRADATAPVRRGRPRRVA